MKRRDLLLSCLAAGASAGMTSFSFGAGSAEAVPAALPETAGVGKPAASKGTPASPIMIIRHAEKPIGDERAIDVVGNPSDADLIVRGWQRAGALVCFFAPTHGPLQDASLAVPKFVFASWPKGEDPAPGVHGSEKPKSHRPRHTVESLCAKLNLKLNAEFSKGQEKEVAEAAMACPGPVLISWQHESIPGILNALPGGEAGPKSWPGERFDVVYVLTWDAGAKKYRFSQVPQMLLAGDLATGIAG